MGAQLLLRRNAQGGARQSGSQEGGSRSESEGGSSQESSSRAKGKTIGTTDSDTWQEGRGRTETIRPGLDANEILDASLVDRACLIHSKRDAGKTLLGGRPRPIRCLYSMDMEEYRERRRTVWPAAPTPPPETPPASGRTNPTPPPEPSPKPPAEPAKTPKEHPKRKERGLHLQTFFDEHAPPPQRED